MSRYTQSYGAPQKTSYTQNKNTAQYGGAPTGKRNNMTQIRPEEEQRFKRAFQYFDNDNSGRITSEEFKKALQSLGYTASDDEILQLLKTYDHDGDGLMNFDEFLTMVIHLQTNGFKSSREDLEKRLKNAFSVLDHDGDGYITRAELQYILLNAGNPFSTAEFNAFMKLFDKNNDGRITCNELVEVMCSSLEDFLHKIMK